MKTTMDNQRCSAILDEIVEKHWKNHWCYMKSLNNRWTNQRFPAILDEIIEQTMETQ